MTSISPSTGTRVERWESASEWPLTVTALIFLIAYAWPILDPALPEGAKTFFRTVDVIAWGIFILDYAARLALAERRFHYWSRHLLDLAVSPCRSCGRCDCYAWSSCSRL